MSSKVEMGNSMIKAALNVVANNSFVTGDSAEAKVRGENGWGDVACVDGVEHEVFSYLVHPAVKVNFWCKGEGEVLILMGINVAGNWSVRTRIPKVTNEGNEVLMFGRTFDELRRNG